MLINERNVGKIYRQFLALLSGTHLQKKAQLEQANQEHGGVIWAIDALQPEAHGTLLYVLYEVLSGTVVSGIQLTRASAQDIELWLAPFEALNYKVLATLSDGDPSLIEAFQNCWPDVPHQRCQLHFLTNLSEDVLPFDKQLRTALSKDLKGLPKVPEHSTTPDLTPEGSLTRSPLF